MLIPNVATLCAGIFAGAAIYINAVEHPARLSCGTEVALREFAPSYHRATLMQVPLALVGCFTGVWWAWLRGDAWVALGPFFSWRSCRSRLLRSCPRTSSCLIRLWIHEVRERLRCWFGGDDFMHCGVPRAASPS